jgi:hypothetical protein
MMYFVNDAVTRVGAHGNNHERDATLGEPENSNYLLT